MIIGRWRRPLQGPAGPVPRLAVSLRAVRGTGSFHEWRGVLPQPAMRLNFGVAPMLSTLAILTTSPDVGACTICPLPR
jgi:hypothetical protein